MIVADSSVIYALLDRRDGWHERVAGWYERSTPELATTPLVLAEVDHLASARLGRDAVVAWRQDLASDAYRVEWWSAGASEAAELASSYTDSGVSLTDASLVALASRIGTVEIATLDERHFRLLRPLTGEPGFRLVPLDS